MPHGPLQYNAPTDANVWGGSRALPAAATAEVAQLNVPGFAADYGLVLRLAGAPARLTVTSFYQGGAISIDHTTILGDGGGWTLPPAGSWSLTAQNLSLANTCTVTWLLVRAGHADLHAPYDFPLTGLVEGGGGAAGAWFDLSDIGLTSQGWAPPDRHQLALIPSTAVDFQFIDEAGAVVFGAFTSAAPVRLKHPGRARLQARHPGASPTPAAVIAIWNRA